MARSTCNPYAEVPKGMMKFEVIRSTIRDSLGQYCAPGDMAVLTKQVAKGYLDKNFIKVALPDFDEGEDEPDSDDGSGEDAAERNAVETSARPRRRQGRSRASVNGEGREPSS